jgi:glycosyl hydrolase family 10
MTRRELVRLIAMMPWASWQTVPVQNAEAADRLRLSAPLTHSDWVLKDGVAWGDEGVRHMLDACKACGWSRIYWRALDSGRALYRSKLRDPMGLPEEDNYFHPVRPEDEKWSQGTPPERRAEILRKMSRYDYAHFDSLASAVRYGHQIGLEIHAWLSINEDDHGWGWPSRFTKAHSEYRWRRRDGAFYRSQLSFAFPEVRQHKLAIVEEIVRGYDVDGIFLDWIRTGDVRDNPQTDPEGVANYGYEEPLIQAFQARYKLNPRDLPNGDERWVRFRARPQTLFMGSVRKLLRAARPRLPLSVMVAHPWCYRGNKDRIDGSLRGLLLDVKTWAREGLIDAAVPAGYYMESGTPEGAYQALTAQTEGKVDVWLYAWVPDSFASFEREFALAKKLGARQILFWEADYIDDRPNREELQRAMRSHAL